MCVVKNSNCLNLSKFCLHLQSLLELTLELNSEEFFVNFVKQSFPSMFSIGIGLCQIYKQSGRIWEPAGGF